MPQPPETERVIITEFASLLANHLKIDIAGYLVFGGFEELNAARNISRQSFPDPHRGLRRHARAALHEFHSVQNPAHHRLGDYRLSLFLAFECFPACKCFDYDFEREVLLCLIQPPALEPDIIQRQFIHKIVTVESDSDFFNFFLGVLFPRETSESKPVVELPDRRRRNRRERIVQFREQQMVRREMRLAPLNKLHHVRRMVSRDRALPRPRQTLRLEQFRQFGYRLPQLIRLFPFRHFSPPPVLDLLIIALISVSARFAAT